MRASMTLTLVPRAFDSQDPSGRTRSTSSLRAFVPVRTRVSKSEPADLIRVRMPVDAGPRSARTSMSGPMARISPAAGRLRVEAAGRVTRRIIGWPAPEPRPDRLLGRAALLAAVSATAIRVASRATTLREANRSAPPCTGRGPDSRSNSALRGAGPTRRIACEIDEALTGSTGRPGPAHRCDHTPLHPTDPNSAPAGSGRTTTRDGRRRTRRCTPPPPPGPHRPSRREPPGSTRPGDRGRTRPAPKDAWHNHTQQALSERTDQSWRTDPLLQGLHPPPNRHAAHPPP